MTWSVTISNASTRIVNIDEPVHANGWNIISGTGFIEGETITIKCEHSPNQYTDLGAVVVDIDGTWKLYFSIENIDYWPVDMGESRIMLTVTSSRGLPVRLFLRVIDDMDLNIYPPRDYLYTKVIAKNKVVKDILWKIYIRPDISSNLYREITMEKIILNRQLNKNLHYRIRGN